MSSVVLDSVSFDLLSPRVTNDDEDIEMSDDGSTIAEQQQQDAVQTQTALYEIIINEKHELFNQIENQQYMRRVNVITSFLSLMEISPVKAFALIKEASQEPNSRQFRDYMLFKQISLDLQRVRELRSALNEKSRKYHSREQQSIIGSHTQLDTLQWMFSFFNMHSVPFHHKDLNSEANDIVLYLRESTSNGPGKIAAVVLAQNASLDQQSNDELSTVLSSILQELESSDDSRTRLGVIVNCNAITLLAVDSDKSHQRDNSNKQVKSLSIAQKDFDLCDVSDFAELVTILELFLATSLNVESAKNDKQEIKVVQEEDMESSPLPKKSFSAFPEKDHFFIDKFNTSLSYVYIPPHLAGSFASSSTLDFHCVKKRSHFCSWERSVLDRLTIHPYIIRELDLEGLPIDYETTIMFENVKPMNKRMFSLTPMDNQGNSIHVSQQIINNRFEILRQFLKQALHSVVYCHNNGIVHNNILSRGGTFGLDDQYKLKLMGFEHSLFTDDNQLRYRDMKHLAVAFAELMFATQFNIKDDDDSTDWTEVWNEIQTHIDKYQDMVEKCPRTSPNDKLLYVVNTKTKDNMFDLLKQMFFTSDPDYYHTYMYHAYIGMASSMYKEKSKQKLREKTVHMLHGSKTTRVIVNKKESVAKNVLIEKWTAMRAKSTM